jgi:serine/threonine-protein kinase
MDFLVSFLNNAYLPWLLLAVALLVGYQKLAPRLKIRAPGMSFTLDDVAGKLLGPRYAAAKVDRAVARLKKQGNYLAAGRLYEEHERLAESVDAYSEGREFFAAASVLERMGRGEKAAELFLQAGDHKKAAQVFVQAGKPARAAALLLERGNNLEAARLYGVANQWAQAADLYMRSGYPLRAAEAYEKTGEFLKAAECHEKHFMENVSYATTYSSTAPSQDVKSALMAGRLYEKSGDPQRALQVYQKGGYFKEAASVCLELGQYDKAAELFMRAEDPASAASAFEQGGDPVRAATLRGEVAFKQDRAAEAAAFFQQGQDYLRAAELFESVGMLKEAAGAFEAGESYAAAGGVYVRAGLKERAAASYARAGEFETGAKLYEEAGQGQKAAELYERAGLTFKSGEAAARAGDRDRAIQLLQRVGSQDENYNAATELLARLFIESGRPGLAVERLQKVIAGQPVGAATLDLYYWLAAAHETSGDARAALDLYKKVQAEDLHFRDVEARVARLQAQVVGGASAPPSRAAALPVAAVAVTPQPLPAAAGAPPAAAKASAGGGNASAPAANQPVPQPAPSTPAAPRPGAAASTPGPAAKSGARVPRFTPREEIGRGPLGVLYRGEDSDGRNVALRVLPPGLLAGDGVVHALVAGLKAASQLSHPNVVKVLGFMELGGQRCVVTEFVAGRNFAEALKAGHKMTFQQVHGLGRVLAQALSTIHGKGLVHGSVQPSNVMVASGVVKLADLGLGRLAQTQNAPDAYQPPESRLGPAGDLYALACVLYHLLTGVHPRTQPQGSALPLPSKQAIGVPEAFDKLLLRCLHPREELRHPSAEAILRELKEMVRIG